MSVLERRLQILIDHERFRLLESEAGRTGRSVAAIVRGALDAHFEAAAAIELRAAAADRLLAVPSVAEEPVDWADAKRDLQSSLDRVGRA
ncbi:hypothetical protein [Cellulomonas rhizosphaerae]|uniref:Ribbon-helix-helix protein, CopG family n=1 Tax=Cellulomonas rhizosphaerae TaxID=2293719 RepID=A0A413RMT0_9CELL|nr:hypothetical protein [Cellulomonas rhizosphaerae]RHA42290.1 hypothetical protein D1825_07500 [Cellulomonas rhizosphaerae]